MRNVSRIAPSLYHQTWRAIGGCAWWAELSNLCPGIFPSLPEKSPPIPVLTRLDLRQTCSRPNLSVNLNMSVYWLRKYYLYVYTYLCKLVKIYFKLFLLLPLFYYYATIYMVNKDYQTWAVLQSSHYFSQHVRIEKTRTCITLIID